MCSNVDFLSRVSTVCHAAGLHNRYYFERSRTMTVSARSSLFTTFQYGLLIIICLVMMAPVATAFLGSIRTTGEFLSQPFGLPQQGIQWANYGNILTNPSFWASVKNSLLITIGVTVLNVTCAS